LAAGQVRRGSPCTAVEANFPGLIWLARGKVRTALRFCRESAALLREGDAAAMLAFALAGIAEATAQADERDAARATIAQMERTPWAQRLRGRVGAGASMERRRERRARVLARATRCARTAHGQDAYALRALHELCRLGDPAAAAPELAWLTDEVDGPFVAIAAAQAGRPRRYDHPRASTDLQPSPATTRRDLPENQQGSGGDESPSRAVGIGAIGSSAHARLPGHFVTKSRGDSTTLVGWLHPRSRPAARDA
jgi:hypothetical protein